MKTINKLRPFTKFCCSIGELPTSYMESLTYEEQLMWLCKYLETTVIPTVNANGEAVEELQSLYIELKNYVDQYFDNNLPQLLSDKLDEMAEDGTLENIIGRYIDRHVMRNYPTVNMLKSADLPVGLIVETAGYYIKNDGGGARYYITGVEPTTHYELLNNGKYAELLTENGNVSLNQLGAYGNGTDDDSAIIQYAIDYCATNKLKLTGCKNSTYLIKKTINITSLQTDIDLNDAYISIHPEFEATNDCFIYINVSGGNHGTFKRISHFRLDCNHVNVGKAVNVAYLGRCFFEYVFITKCRNIGLYVSGGFEVYYNKIFMNAIQTSITSASEIGNRVAIECTTDDLYFNDITAIDFSTCLNLHDTSNYFNNIHAWIYTGLNVKNSKFAIIERGTATLTNCYADTYESVLCASQNSGNYKCYGLKTFFNGSFFPTPPTDLNMYLFKQTTNMTDYYYFRRSVIRNSILKGNTDYHYNLSNTTKTLLADLDVSNTYSNIDNTDVINRATVTYIEGVTNRTNRIFATDGITNFHIEFSMDISGVSTSADYKIGNITNYKLAPKTYFSSFGYAVNSTTHAIYPIQFSIDQSVQDNNTSGQVRLRITQTLKDAGVDRFTLDASFINTTSF